MIKSCYSFNLSIQKFVCNVAGDYLRQMHICGQSLQEGVPIFLIHDCSAMKRHLADFPPPIELIMTGFNVEKTSESYFNNSIIQMKK